jgi:hypothetical protein
MPFSFLGQIPVFDVCLPQTESCFTYGECCIPTITGASVAQRSDASSFLGQIPVFDVCLPQSESCFTCGECCIPTIKEKVALVVVFSFFAFSAFFQRKMLNRPYIFQKVINNNHKRKGE